MDDHRLSEESSADATGAQRLARITAAALAVSSAEGPNVFEQLATALADLLRVDASMIAAAIPERPGRMRTLATRLDGRTLALFEYDVERSPCRHMAGRASRFVAQGVREEFAPDTIFHARGMDAYAARSLVDPEGRQIGLIVAMNRAPLADRELTETLLQIFGVRAAAELERMSAADAVSASEQSYRAIFDAAEDAIFVHDWDTGAILDVSPKATEIYGLDRSELLKMRIADVSLNEPPYTEAEAIALIEQAKHQDKPLRFAWRARHRDGHLMWHEVTLKPAWIGGARRVLAFVRDITERYVRDEEVRQSEARLRATIQSAFDSLIGIDDEGRIIEFNAAAERCFGYTRADVIGRPLAELVIPPRYRAAHAAGMARFRVTREGPYIGRRVETTALRADGTEFPVELTIGVAPSRDGDMFIGYLRDISDRKRAEAERAALEAQLRQAQKMEAIGQLTGGIAHDFNNILASIMGYLVLAVERPTVAGDVRLGEYLDEALHSCRRARDLIQQMLTFSRAQHGERRALAAGSVVREVAQMLRVTLPATLALDAETLDAESTVVADPVQLQQVVLNLCINARDAQQGSGRIELRVASRHVANATCASCGAAASGRFVELAVADDGPGITPDVRARMFDPFFSTKAPGKGSGMGLATVHRLVHEHGGHVLVDTEPGRGTRFSVLLPEAQQEATAPQAPGARPAPPRFSGRVLLVDDEGSVLNFMRELLMNWGLDVHAVASGTEARALLVKNPQAWDLLLTDQTMPGLTGVELAEAVRAVREDLPVILYSGNPGEIETQRERLGLCRVLHKPIEPAALRAALAACLNDPCC